MEQIQQQLDGRNVRHWVAQKVCLLLLTCLCFYFFANFFYLALELKTSPSADAQTEIAHSFWVIFLY